MAVIFKLKDVMHRITAKFFPAYLPKAKKPYYLHAKHQPELDIHGIASKAETYGIPTDPLVMEEVLNYGLELITYLAADGFKIKTPVFTLKVAIPGEYDGTETHLPDGVKPEGRLNLSPELRKYLREHVELQIEGIEENPGIIGEVIDLETHEINQTLHVNNIFEVRGAGLKIAADADHADDVGIFLELASTDFRIKLDPKGIAVNEPRTLKVFLAIPEGLPAYDPAFYVVVRTQLSATSGATLLKHVREVKSDFTVTIEE